MKGKKLFKNSEEGFTLIEIIAVLVIMGILAAVAVPKFFDLQERAREKAIKSAVSEIKVRVNQHFASQLLDGETVGQISYLSGSVGIGLGEDYLVADWDDTTDAANITFTITYYPDPTDTTKNALTKTEAILKPQTGS